MFFKFLFSFIIMVFTLSFFPGNASLSELREKYGEELTSRFIVKSDKSEDAIACIPLRFSWWSRSYEYAWTSTFADENSVVLDAACGISHPFKWYLGETCKETWACDVDPRIDTAERVIQETYDDLGQVAYDVLVNSPQFFNHVKLVRASICQLPPIMPQFDRIFCISTLEHLDEKDRFNSMQEFARFLAVEGLLILTVDYPEVTPEALIKLANSVGLVPAGDVEFNCPEDLLTNGSLSIYRCVLIHKEFKKIK